MKRWRTGARLGGGLRHAVAVVALVGFSAAAQAPLDIRVALVIGNAAYPAPATLANPVNDAAAMSASLARLGFEVTEVRDGTRAQMAEAIAAVREKLKGKQGVGMLYYAGHGLQVDWRNYMVPVDARPANAADVAAQTIHLDSVIDAFKAAGNRINIVVLDACRDNPFAGTTSAKGLAQVDAPPGTFLAYATAPGNVAEDGTGSNGLYTGYLLQELARPAARIEDVFKRVRLQVRQKSDSRQIPWESTSLEDDFSFNDGRAAATRLPIAVPATRATPAAREEMFAAEKADWDRIKASRNADDVYAFLQKHPSGLISEAAQDKLNLLAQPRVEAAPVQGRGRIQREARAGDEIEYVYRDILTRLETRRETLRVTAVQDGLIEYNGGAQVVTLSGASVRNDNGIVFDPPLQGLPAGEFQIGHQWVSRATQTLPRGLGGTGAPGSGGPPASGWAEQEVKVVGYEQVTVPAGTFQAWRLEAVVRSHTGLYGKMTSWVTDAGVLVRYERRARHMNGRDNSWIREAVRIHRPR